MYALEGNSDSDDGEPNNCAVFMDREGDFVQVVTGVLAPLKMLGLNPTGCQACLTL